MNGSENMHLVQAKGILSAHNGINVYRGCTHGCIYCDSRSLCYHTPVPFEDIEVTEDMVGHKLGEFAPTRTFKGHVGSKTTGKK